MLISFLYQIISNTSPGLPICFTAFLSSHGILSYVVGEILHRLKAIAGKCSYVQYRVIKIYIPLE